MGLDKEREVLKKELEKTTGSVGLSSGSKEVPQTRKVGVGIRTYAADIADIMRREKGSVIKIALAEQERRRAYQEKRDPTSTRNIIVILLGIIFIVSGIMIFVYSIMNRSAPIPATLNQTVLPGLIYTENQTQTDITNMSRGNLFNTIHEMVRAPFAEIGTITNIAMISQTSVGRSATTAQNFFSKLGIAAPGRVTNTFTGAFMLGSHKQTSDGNLFLMIKIKDYNESFSAMREWEISMVSDLVRLFQIDSRNFAGNIFLKNFQNAVLFNKDARSVYDDDGVLVLTYVYADRNTVIITTNSGTVGEVVKRMNIQSIR